MNRNRVKVHCKRINEKKCIRRERTCWGSSILRGSVNQRFKSHFSDNSEISYLSKGMEKSPFSYQICLVRDLRSVKIFLTGVKGHQKESFKRLRLNLKLLTQKSSGSLKKIKQLQTNLRTYSPNFISRQKANFHYLALITPSLEKIQLYLPKTIKQNKKQREYNKRF